MARVVLVFKSDQRFGEYIAQLDDLGLSANIDKWMIKGTDHHLVGEDLPAPDPPGTFFNQHVLTVKSERRLEQLLTLATLPSDFRIKNKGAYFTIAGLDGTVVTPEVQDVYDKMGFLTDQERQHISVFVKAQVLSGNWGTKASNYSDSRISYFTHFGLSNAGDGLTSWRNTFTAVPVNAPNLVQGVGYDFNGADQYINTNYNPLNDSIGAVDNVILGAFLTSDGQEAVNRSIIGAIEGTLGHIIWNQAAGFKNMQINTVTGSNIEGIMVAGLNIGAREGSDPVPQNFFYIDGVQVSGLSVIIATQIPDQNLFFGARNNAGTADLHNSFSGSSVIMGNGIGFNQLSFNNDLRVLNNELEILATLASFPNALGLGEAVAIATFLRAEMASGNWFKYDSFACFALADPINALFDWKRRSNMVNTDAVHTSGVGFDFNGTTAFINSNYNPSTDGVNYKQDDALVGIFIVSNTSNNSVLFYPTAQSTAGTTIRNQGDGTIRSSINGGSSTRFLIEVFESNALYVTKREVSTDIEFLKNGIEVDATDSISVSVISFNFNIGSRESGNDPFTGIISSFIAGAAIGFNQAGFNTNLRALLGGL